MRVCRSVRHTLRQLRLKAIRPKSLALPIATCLSIFVSRYVGLINDTSDATKASRTRYDLPRVKLTSALCIEDQVWHHGIGSASSYEKRCVLARNGG